MKVKVGVMYVCFHRTVTCESESGMMSVCIQWTVAGESESGCDVCLLS